MKFKLVSSLILIFTVVIFMNAQFADAATEVHILGAKRYFKAAPYIENGTTMVPASEVVPAIGAKYSYNSKTKVITISRGLEKITVKVGSKAGQYVTGVPQSSKTYSKAVALKQPATLKNNVAYVPLTFIADGLGYVTFYKNGIVYLDINYKPSNTYNWHLAMASSNISSQAYNKNAQPVANKQVLQSYGFTDVTLVGANQSIFSLKPMQVLLGQKTLPNGTKVYAISFRGTEINKVGDLAMDVMIKKVSYGDCSGCQAASGFATYVSHLTKQHNKVKIGNKTLENIVKNAKSTDIFWVTGHSLGGAAANLYSSFLADKGIKRSQIITYTFGSPRVVNNKFAAHYKNKFYYHRITNPNDPFVHLPYKDGLAGLNLLSNEFTAMGNRHVVYQKNPAKNTVKAFFTNSNYISQHKIQNYSNHVRSGNILLNQ